MKKRRSESGQALVLIIYCIIFVFLCILLGNGCDARLEERAEKKAYEAVDNMNLEIVDYVYGIHIDERGQTSSASSVTIVVKNNDLKRHEICVLVKMHGAANGINSDFTTTSWWHGFSPQVDGRCPFYESKSTQEMVIVIDGSLGNWFIYDDEPIYKLSDSPVQICVLIYSVDGVHIHGDAPVHEWRLYP